ncbi:CAS [Linum grandiflorum]
MDLSPDFLVQCFVNTFSTAREPRKAAEDYLKAAANAPNYALAVLNLVGTPTVDEQIRSAAAVNFKNHLRQRWAPGQDSDFNPIPDQEKSQIKSLIVSLMLSSSTRIQSQLSEALSLIGKHDFPKLWESLLPELIANLRAASLANNYATVNGILGTANSIFKKFRYQYKSNELFTELKYCLDNFAAPLLEIFRRTAVLIDSAISSGVETLRPWFESQRLCCRIFYSLNFQELPEFFEDHMSEWMTEFKKYLTSNYPAMESSGPGLAIADDLRAAVCENISLYMEKNEEEFQPYLNDFALAVWSLLVNVSQNPSRDRLAVTAIKFLTTVSTSVHHSLFREDGIILQICQNIVIPNVRLRDDDEELFEMDCTEYIRRDMEGSDLDTRRRIACELLKGIAANYKQQVTSIVSAQIQILLSSFATNPAQNWKDKDCAIYLVVSLASKKSGGVDVSTDIVDVENFFASVIVPELQSQDVNSCPMLKAGALKFFTMFRNQIRKDRAIHYLRDLVRFLGAESKVVHSYAASCIEKLLLVKDDGASARYTASDLAPFVLVLMTNLFNALRFEESTENHYIMKCIMRVIGVAEINNEIADHCSIELTSILNIVCRNPKNPVFNHYLFESVAALVRRACERDRALIPAFEQRLFPSLQLILGEDVAEFLPYAFQLLAQLVELNRPPIPPIYMQIFMLLLSPESWNTSSNVPALVRLLQAFLQKAPHELNQEGQLKQVIVIFERLISSSSTEEQGFHLLNTVIENLEFAVIYPYMGRIWLSLFNRLQKKETAKFVKSLVIFMSLFLIKHGHGNLINTMNEVQANIFVMILEKFWIPKVKLITGHIEVKLVAVASCRLICESPVLSDPAAAMHWGKMLDGIVTLLSKPEEHRVEVEPEMPDIAETGGYTATFVNLYNAGKKEDDPLREIRDPKQFLVASLSRLAAASPGKYPQIINQNVDSANQTALLQLCNTYNCPIV